MFYLTTQSTHFIYGYMASDRDHSDSERGNSLPQGIFYMHHPIDMIAHITANYYTSCGTLAGTRNSSMSPT